MTNPTSALVVRRMLILLILLGCGFGAGESLVSAQQNSDRVTSRSSSTAPDRGLLEEFSFYIKNFKMDHQGEVQTLNLKVSIQYANGLRDTDYPDFRLIAKDVESTLSKYPNKTDYWEVVNKRITQLVMDKYAGVDRVMIEIEVSASATVPYLRASTVTRVRRKK